MTRFGGGEGLCLILFWLMILIPLVGWSLEPLAKALMSEGGFWLSAWFIIYDYWDKFMGLWEPWVPASDIFALLKLLLFCYCWVRWWWWDDIVLPPCPCACDALLPPLDAWWFWMLLWPTFPWAVLFYTEWLILGLSSPSDWTVASSSEEVWWWFVC